MGWSWYPTVLRQYSDLHLLMYIWIFYLYVQKFQPSHTLRPSSRSLTSLDSWRIPSEEMLALVALTFFFSLWENDSVFPGRKSIRKSLMCSLNTELWRDEKFGRQRLWFAQDYCLITLTQTSWIKSNVFSTI